LTNQPFERVAPGSVGIASGAIQKYLDHLDRANVEMHGLMILRHGKVAAQGWWQPYGPGIRHSAWSMTKSYVSTAVGLAFDDGLLDPSEPILKYFPEFAPTVGNERLSSLTIHHLLSMSCGMEPGFGRGMTDWIRDFFECPIANEPGSVFYYNNSASSILAALVKRVTGKDFTVYLQEKLLDDIGVGRDEISCIRLPDGSLFGAAGLFSTTEANARLGQLYLQKGKWNGRQLLSEEWIAKAASKQIDVTPPPGSPEQPEIKDRFKHAAAGYGYQLWMCDYPGSFRFDGAMGQYVVVVPSLDLVVAVHESSMNSSEGPMCAVNAVFEDLLPGIQDEPISDFAASDAKSASRLSSLSMPNLYGCGDITTQQSVQCRDIYLSEPGISLLPYIFNHLAGKPAVYSRVRLSFASGDVKLSLNGDQSELTITAGMDGISRLNFMQTALPIRGYVAAQAAWVKPGTLQVSLCMPETNFTTTLTFVLTGDNMSVTVAENMTFTGQPVEPRIVQATIR
jgi:CubicO group peptidase (beta-lactamase class C family)